MPKVIYGGQSVKEIPVQAKFKCLGKVKAEHILAGASNHLFHHSLSPKTQKVYRCETTLKVTFRQTRGIPASL